MKQKVVIQLSMNGNDHKSRSKAFKIAVSQPGVESATIQGQENNQLEVVGEQIDAVVLANLLRKKFGLAEIVTFGPVAVGDKNKSQDVMMLWQPYNYQSHYVVPQYHAYEVRDSYQQGCSIM
ncbi:heavy metal-associated isoprenylated plant protein 41-like [Lycium ferocissimum]|uniref:heavy metal-associated isoprenylated plant protein 41-like n=1 Tax=Lycium ferocissimum TaxID=112874 RepID=UPI0028167AB4|nr:heavy metal-associated isoprenylated plant protein 41-like [Lycium ferocissimum]